MVRGVARISAKNQLTIPVAALEEAGLRVRRGAVTFGGAFGALTGAYPSGYLERLDAEDEQR